MQYECKEKKKSVKFFILYTLSIYFVVLWLKPTSIIYFIKSTLPFTSVNTAFATLEETSS